MSKEYLRKSKKNYNWAFKILESPKTLIAHREYWGEKEILHNLGFHTGKYEIGHPVYVPVFSKTADCDTGSESKHNLALGLK